jgi:outer membrane protein
VVLPCGGVVAHGAAFFLQRWTKAPCLLPNLAGLFKIPFRLTLMKLLLNIALLLVLFSTAPDLHAQNSGTKFGYINSLEVINLLPESRQADSLLANYQREIQTQYTAYGQEYNAKLQEYLRVKDSLSEFVATSRLSDLQALEKRIKEFESGSQSMLQRKREELLAPVLMRAQALIKEVAQENGYRMIFDVSTGSLAYAPESDNVLGLVKKKLGLE